MKAITAIVLSICSITSQIICNDTNLTAEDMTNYMLTWDEQYISSLLLLQNETIYCDGNLSVEAGGHLIIMDSELKMNAQFNASRKILVKNGGIFELINSKLISNTSYSYEIFLQQGSICRFVSSEIKNFSYYCGTDTDSGINTASTDFRIDNSKLFFNGYGIIAQNANIVITNSTFYPANINPLNGVIDCIQMINSLDADFQIENCSIYGALNYDSSYDSAPGLILKGKILMANSTIIQCANLFSNTDMTNVITNSNFITHIGRSFAATRIYGKGITFENCHVINNKSIALECANSNMTFSNSSADGSDRDIILKDDPRGNAIINMVNSNYSTYTFENDANQINDIHLLNLRVISEKTKNGLDNATIKIFDNDNIQIFNDRTDSFGKIDNIHILDKGINRISTTVFTPHIIVVEKDGVSSPAKYIDMNSNQDTEIMFDDVPPQLAVIYPPEGLITNSSLINIIGTSEKGSKVTVNGNGINNVEGAINSTFWLVEGNNTLVIRATDASGNFAETSWNVTCILASPSVVITEPKDGTITNATPLRISGTTNGTRLEINGVPVQLNTSGGFSYMYAFSSEGLHTITATAWNIANNSNFFRVKVTYDSIPPSIVVAVPCNESYTNSSTITIEGWADGAANLEIDGSEVNQAKNGFFEFSVALIEGRNTIELLAKDAANNYNSTVIIIYRDSSNFLEILELKDNLLINFTEIELKGRTEPNAEVTVNGVKVENRDGGFTYLLEMKEGQNTISIYSVDRAGNLAYHILEVTVDITPPGITILAPGNTTLSMESALIRIRSEADANLTINGQSPLPEGNGIFSLSETLQEGENRFLITARDPAGNVRTKELVLTYIPDKPRPSQDGETGIPAWILVCIAVIVMAVAVTGGYVYLRKRNMG